MHLGETLQLVLQKETPQGNYLCEGFSGIPVTHPCFIVLATDGTPESFENAGRLRDLICEEIRRLSPAASSKEVPCKGEISDPGGCHAHRAVHCRKLLVLIGNGCASLPWHSNFDDWMSRDDSYVALPIIPESGKTNLAGILRSAFSMSNAVSYTHHIDETLPAILSAVGLTAEDHRIFISYNRDDTGKLAEQLFDALTHEGFDVFFDRFRVPPALNFQRRLFQELADKSMVLVLESEHFDESQWTRCEIEFAVKHRLGVFALQVPLGKDLTGIEEDSRMHLTHTDYKDKDKETLTDYSLAEVVSRIKLERGRKLVWRRGIVRDSMKNALAAEGLHRLDVGPTGVISVDSVTGPTVKRYAICLTSRPPELRDFHETHLHTHGGTASQGLVVGPISSQEPERLARLNWLGDVSQVPCFDEGTMIEVARAIKGGSL